MAGRPTTDDLEGSKRRILRFVLAVGIVTACLIALFLFIGFGGFGFDKSVAPDPVTGTKRLHEPLILPGNRTSPSASVGALSYFGVFASRKSRTVASSCSFVTSNTFSMYCSACVTELVEMET